jgi:DNA-binding transcriptional regulator YdaS (Cro superfamily)
MKNTNPLDRAIKAIGSQQALADLLGIKSPSITEWRQRGRVPAERCGDIERATAGAVTALELRPDVLWTRDSSGEITGYHVRLSAA